MNENTLSQEEKIALLKDPNNKLTREQAEFVQIEMAHDQKRFKLNILVMKINRGYKALGRDTFKEYVIKDLPFTYDAVIKQMIAANAAIKLFGPDKVGYYSDSSMITLSSLHIEVQVKVIIELMKKFNKGVGDALLPKELTKKMIDEALKKLSPSLGKNLNNLLPSDCKDEGYSEIEFDLHPDVFEIADEQAYKDKYGFSRWDEQSLQLVKADELASLSAEELKRKLELSWSVMDMVKHVKTFYPDKLDSALQFSQRGHDYLVHFMMEIYIDSDEVPEYEEDSDEVNVDDDDDDDDDEYDIDDLESNYPEPSSDSEKKQYVIQCSKLVGKIQSLTAKSYVGTHPKLAVIKALFDILDQDDLLYIYAKSSEMLNEIDEEDDSEYECAEI